MCGCGHENIFHEFEANLNEQQNEDNSKNKIEFESNKEDDEYLQMFKQSLNEVSGFQSILETFDEDDQEYIEVPKELSKNDSFYYEKGCAPKKERKVKKLQSQPKNILEKFIIKFTPRDVPKIQKKSKNIDRNSFESNKLNSHTLNKNNKTTSSLNSQQFKKKFIIFSSESESDLMKNYDLDSSSLESSSDSGLDEFEKIIIKSNKPSLFNRFQHSEIILIQ